MARGFFLIVKPDQKEKLWNALNYDLQRANRSTAERIRRVLSELQGINETDRGFNRQMILTKPELRLVGNANRRHKLGLDITDLSRDEM